MEDDEKTRQAILTHVPGAENPEGFFVNEWYLQHGQVLVLWDCGDFFRDGAIRGSRIGGVECAFERNIHYAASCYETAGKRNLWQSIACTLL